jgi:hypothetical protein
MQFICYQKLLIYFEENSLKQTRRWEHENFHCWNVQDKSLHILLAPGLFTYCCVYNVNRQMYKDILDDSDDEDLGKYSPASVVEEREVAENLDSISSFLAKTCPSSPPPPPQVGRFPSARLLLVQNRGGISSPPPTTPHPKRKR